ncbi:MAG: GYF domain-containing protein [Bacteriovoracaceae bacterium]
MADNWYYVQKGNRHGPVDFGVLESLIAREELKQEDFVWKKGFENWKKIKDVSELIAIPKQSSALDLPPVEFADVNLKDLDSENRIIYVRIGIDRGGAFSDYGPFNIKQLKQLFKENRINGKTLIFCKGMRDWKILGDLPEYQEIFQQMPPVIKEVERRVNVRKPFIARMFVQNNKKVFEGICRDISIGGMQVLIDNFQGQSGDKITINVHPENTEYHFTASGQVVRILEGNSGFSFRFQGLSEDAKKSIERYVQEN